MLYNKPRLFEIIDKRRESRRVTTLFLSAKNFPRVIPGQFLMVWAPEAEEIPIALSGQEENWIALSIDNVGKTTEIMCGKTVGDSLGVRGPYGNGFDLTCGSSYLLVGSGCGISPLYFAALRLKEAEKKVEMLLDARSEGELCFINQFENLGVRTEISTHDGSVGYSGYGSELGIELLNSSQYDFVLTCGPEKMMKELHTACMKRGIRFQASLERYMRCGFGLCGSCSLDPTGLLVCKDGPVFDGEILSKTFSFGKSKRERDGSVKTI